MTSVNFALLKAAFLGKYDELISLIAEGADPNFKSEESGVTPLYNAVAGNRIECVEALLQNGANVNLELRMQSIVDGSPRVGVCAVCFAKSEEMLQLLLDHKAQLNCSDHNGVTPLMLLCGSAEPDAIKLALRSVACRDARDRKGKDAKGYLLDRIARDKSLFFQTKNALFNERAEILTSLMSEHFN